MSEIGALIIRLQAETAQFREDMGKVKDSLKDLKDQGKDTGDALDYSMLNARGSMMIIEQISGVRLPRALNTLVASIGPVGSAFAMMLPIIGVAAALAIILKLVDAHEKLAAAVRKSEGDNALLSMREEDTAKSMELANLKIQDQINKLQGGIGKNHLAEALIQTAMAADKLAEKMLEDFLTIDEKLTESTGVGHSYWNAIYDNIGAIAQGGGVGLAFAVAQASGWRTAMKAVDDTTSAVTKATTAYHEAASGSDAQKAAQAALAKSYQNVIDAAQKAQNFLDPKNNDADLKAYDQLNQKIIEAQGGLTQLALQAKNTGLALKLGGLEDKNAGLQAEIDLTKIATQGSIAHAEALRKEAQSNAQFALSQIKGDPTTSIQDKLDAEVGAINAEHDAAVSAANDELAAKQQTYNKEIQMAAAGTEKRKELDAQLANAVTAHNDAIVAADNAANNKIVSAMQATENERKRISEDELNTRVANAKAAAAAEIESIRSTASQGLENVKSKEDLGQFASKTAALKAYIQVLTQEQGALRAAQAAEDASLQSDIKKAQVAYDAAKGTEKEAEAYKNLSNAQNALVAADAKFGQEQQQITNQITQQQMAVTKLQATWKTFFGEMRQSLPSIGTAIRTDLQNSINQFTVSFANDMAKSIVESKNLAQAVRKSAAEMLESMLSYLIQWAEKRLMTAVLSKTLDSSDTATTLAANKAKQMSAAELAGANMMATWAAAPWPVDAGAPAMAAAAFSQAMSFEVGGKIPGAGAVPIVGHGGETVVTKALTDRVEQSERGGNVNNSRSSTFAPTIHASALEQAGMQKTLKTHVKELHRMFMAEVRRHNKR